MDKKPNYFIIHALGRTPNDYWYEFVKQQVEKRGCKCVVPLMPPIEQMSYESWKRAFDGFKPLINENSIFIGHSTGSIFIVKYLLENRLKIKKFIGVVSFNRKNTKVSRPEWDEINQTFFVNNLAEFKNLAAERICFYSPTDIYDFDALDDFATQIDAKKVVIDNAGHFTKGYETQFAEILPYL